MTLTPDPASPQQPPLSDKLPQPETGPAVEKPQATLNHTPEPWFLHDWKDCSGFPGSWCSIISSDPDPTKLRSGEIALVFSAGPQAESNASLLRAAPRLLRFVRNYLIAFQALGLVGADLKRIPNPQLEPASDLDEAISILRDLGVQP